MRIQIPRLGVDLRLERKGVLNMLPTGGWWPLVREPFTGAWQSNQETTPENVLSAGAVFACVTLIAADIGKLTLRLVGLDDNGIWTETTSPAFSPVLRKPNRYQTRVKFVEQWIVSKLVHGNTYVLKERDARGLVVALYVLDPTRVTPLVAPDGSVFYQLRVDELSRVREQVTVPAREIIHDLMIALYHPLIGVTPIYACGMAAMQQLAIENNSTNFFTNGSRPGGLLTVPGQITEEQAARLKTQWQENFTGGNVGRVALLTGDLKYENLSINAVDAQLIEQLKWTSENICSCFHVPPYLVDIGPPPPYANYEPLLQKYYSQCLQSLMTSLETSLDEGLGLGPQFGNAFGTEFDIDDLMWMDNTTRTESASKAISSGGLSPNEARAKYFGVGPVAGGESPYLQQQYYSLEALAERDAAQPFAKPTPATPPASPDRMTAEEARAVMAASYRAALHEKAVTAGLYAA